MKDFIEQAIEANKEIKLTPFQLACATTTWGWRTTPASIYYTKDEEPELLKLGPKKWPSRATADWDEFTAWWNEVEPYQRRYVGVVSGENSCLVIDLDGPAAVKRFFEITEGTIPPGCLAYTTPGKGGGAHFIFNYNPEIHVNQFTTVDGIELRGRAIPGVLTIMWSGPIRPDDEEKKGYQLLQFPEKPEPAPKDLLMKLFAEPRKPAPPKKNKSGETIRCECEEGMCECGGFEEVNPGFVLAMLEEGSLTDGRRTYLQGAMWFNAIRGLPMDDVKELAEKMGPKYEKQFERELPRTLENAEKKRAASISADEKKAISIFQALGKGNRRRRDNGPITRETS